MHLKSGLRSLWRNQTQAQIGLDERIRIILDLTDPREHAVLEALEKNHSLSQLRGILQRSRARPERADELVAVLREAGLMIGSTARSPFFSIPAPLRERLAASAETRALLSDGDGWAKQAELTKCLVEVVGLGRTGARIALALAEAGVGQLRLVDPRPVGGRDLGLPYCTSDLGQKRQTALAGHIRNLGTGTTLRSNSYGRPAMTVMVELATPDLMRARDLMYNAQPHFSVVVEECAITCGPWIAPGESPCLRCLSLHMSDADPNWPALGTQLTMRPPTAMRGEDPILAGLAAAYTAGQIVNGLIGLPVTSLDTTTRFSLPDLTPVTQAWQPHPECGCLGPEYLLAADAT